jgi:hypothetical protein
VSANAKLAELLRRVETELERDEARILPALEGEAMRLYEYEPWNMAISSEVRERKAREIRALVADLRREVQCAAFELERAP